MDFHFKENLIKTYTYLPDTGKIFMGEKEVGWVNKNGYTYVTTPFGKKVLAHRLAWLLYYGDWPEGDVDHANRNRSDNRISNLRQFSRSQNLLNMDTPLLRGIYWDKSRGSWRVRVGREGKMSRFKCFGDAYKYRKEQYLERSSA